MSLWLQPVQSGSTLGSKAVDIGAEAKLQTKQPISSHSLPFEILFYL